MEYLRGLEQYESKTNLSGGLRRDLTMCRHKRLKAEIVLLMKLQSIGHIVQIEGVENGWEHMPKPLGSDQAA